MTDLFGQLSLPPLTDAERKRMRRRASEVPRGYAWRPGTGPDGETCKSCAHYCRVDVVRPGDGERLDRYRQRRTCLAPACVLAARGRAGR